MTLLVLTFGTGFFLGVWSACGVLGYGLARHYFRRRGWTWGWKQRLYGTLMAAAFGPFFILTAVEDEASERWTHP